MGSQCLIYILQWEAVENPICNNKCVPSSTLKTFLQSVQTFMLKNLLNLCAFSFETKFLRRRMNIRKSFHILESLVKTSEDETNEKVFHPSVHEKLMKNPKSNQINSQSFEDACHTSQKQKYTLANFLVELHNFVCVMSDSALSLPTLKFHCHCQLSLFNLHFHFQLSLSSFNSLPTFTVTVNFHFQLSLSSFNFHFQLS